MFLFYKEKGGGGALLIFWSAHKIGWIDELGWMQSVRQRELARRLRYLHFRIWILQPGSVTEMSEECCTHRSI